MVLAPGLLLKAVSCRFCAKEEEDLSNKKEEQPTAPRLVVVTLEKDAHLGLKLDMKSSSLQVIDFSGNSGQIQKLNARASDEADKVLVLDFVIEANGHTDVQDMVMAIQGERPLALKFARPVQRVVTIRREEGSSLGLQLAQQADSLCLEVKEIIDGSVQRHNREVPEALRIKPGDLISRANAVSGSSSVILSEIMSAKELEFTLLSLPAATL